MDDKLLDKLTKMFGQQYDKFSKTVSELKERVERRDDDVFIKMDAVYKEVIAFRQELAMHAGSHVRIDETLDSHGKRIKNLEIQKAVV